MVKGRALISALRSPVSGVNCTSACAEEQTESRQPNMVLAVQAQMYIHLSFIFPKAQRTNNESQES